MTSRERQLKHLVTFVQTCLLETLSYRLEDMTSCVKQLKYSVNLVQTCLLGRLLHDLLQVKQWKSSLGPVQNLSLKGSLLVQPEEMTFQVKQLRLSLILGQNPLLKVLLHAQLEKMTFWAKQPEHSLIPEQTRMVKELLHQLKVTFLRVRNPKHSFTLVQSVVDETFQANVTHHEFVVYSRVKTGTLPTMSGSLRQLNSEGDEILQKQWKRMCAALRADDTADKEDVNWDLLKKTARETWYSNKTRVFGVKASKHDQQGLTKCIRSTLHRKGMWFPRTLSQTRAPWEQLVPQPRPWELDGSTDPADIAGKSDDGRLVELAKVRSSCPIALIVIGPSAEVKDHVPDMKQLKEICLVVFDPLTKKYEERGVRQRFTCIHVGSQLENRRTESGECTINELEDSVPMEVWEAFVQNPCKAVAISLLRLDPELEILATYGKRVPSNRESKETKDTSRAGKVSSIQVITRHPSSQEAQVMRISGKQQSGIFIRRTMRKQLEATMILVTQSIFPVWILVECSYPQILERMAECENHHGLTFRIRQRQQIHFALRVEASDLAVTREIFLPQDDRFTEKNRHVAPRTFWSIGPFPYTARAPHIVQAMTRWSEALGTK